MAYKEKIDFKRYYKISEVSDIINLGQQPIRIWLDFFKINVARNNGQWRLFTKKDIDKLKFLKYLVYVERYTLEGAKIKFIEYKTLKNYERNI